MLLLRVRTRWRCLVCRSGSVRVVHNMCHLQGLATILGHPDARPHGDRTQQTGCQGVVPRRQWNACTDERGGDHRCEAPNDSADVVVAAGGQTPHFSGEEVAHPQEHTERRTLHDGPHRHADYDAGGAFREHRDQGVLWDGQDDPQGRRTQKGGGHPVRVHRQAHDGLHCNRQELPSNQRGAGEPQRVALQHQPVFVVHSAQEGKAHHEGHACHAHQTLGPVVLQH
mmetsp:Transcript_38368/g.68547  ORF Transcript_38368/g.68547 Transcript_38368/m.68547 type:complete len:226 (+) Transcript_38368:191-868(+)